MNVVQIVTTALNEMSLKASKSTNIAGGFFTNTGSFSVPDVGTSAGKVLDANQQFSRANRNEDIANTKPDRNKAKANKNTARFSSNRYTNNKIGKGNRSKGGVKTQNKNKLITNK
jgi:hypothetical protein